MMRSALFWDITPRNIPEEHRSHQHSGGSLKSNHNVHCFQQHIMAEWGDQTKQVSSYE
jgi:hypothetical protein